MAKEVGIDQFAASMQDILGEVTADMEAAMPKAVRKSVQVGRREVRKNAKGKFKFSEDSKYIPGWTYKVKKEGDGVSGEIGNKLVPGLPHLLEKGHAKVGGGRVEGREHIADAADKAFDELQDQIEAAVNKL